MVSPQTLSAINAYKQEQNKRTFYFAIIVSINLVGLACLLLGWKTHGVNDANLAWALLFLGVVLCICIIACLFGIYLLYFQKSVHEHIKKKFGIQAVHPTPEFQYFTNTMLRDIQNKRNLSRNSDFSALSTAQVTSDSEERKFDEIKLGPENSRTPKSHENPSNTSMSSENSNDNPNKTLDMAENEATTSENRQVQRFRLYRESKLYELPSCTV